MNALKAFGIASKEFSKQIYTEYLNEDFEFIDDWENSFSYVILFSGVLTFILLQL